MARVLLKPLKGAVWRAPGCYSELSSAPQVKRWLLFQGSITQQLNHLSKRLNKDIKVCVLHQGLERAKTLTLEHALFTCKYLYVREVQLYLGETLVMFARSIIPRDESCMIKRYFKGLGEQALGTLLFQPFIERTHFYLAKINSNLSEYALSVATTAHHPEFIWARCSAFYHKHRNENLKNKALSTNPLDSKKMSDQKCFLLLTEFFSPDFVCNYKLSPASGSI